MLATWGCSTFPKPTLSLDFAGATSLDSRVTFTRATTATYFNSSGVLTTAASGAARFDYNPSTLQPLGLLIEEARTNGIRNNTMQGAVAGSPGTAPTNWSTSGFAGLTREIVGTGTFAGVNYIDIKFSGTSSGVFGDIYFETSSGIAATNSQTWVNSAFLQVVGGSLTNISTLEFTNLQYSSVPAFLAVTTNGTQSAAVSSTWQRISRSATTNNASTAFIRPTIAVGFASGAAIDITLRIGLPQLELGAFATSVIPTTTTALTRNADVASMTGTNFSSWYSASEGTLFAQFLRTASTNSQQGRVFSLSNASNTALIEVYQTSATNPAAQITNTSTQAQWTPTGFTVGISVKEILAYKLNDSNASFNGSAETPDTVCTIPTVTQANIGNRQDGVRALNGYVQRLSYYPTRLPDSTLQALTA